VPPTGRGGLARFCRRGRRRGVGGGSHGLDHPMSPKGAHHALTSR
jgi:hypothetical protein